MECKTFNCFNCNPTIFNPEFYSKCVYCSNKPIYKMRDQGPTTVSTPIKPDFKSVMNQLKGGKTC